MATKDSPPSTKPSPAPSHSEKQPSNVDEPTLLKSFFDYLDTYFSTPSSSWSLPAFKEYASTYPFIRPARDIQPAESWYTRLTKIAACKPPFESASPADVSIAKSHLSKRRKGTSRSTGARALAAAVPRVTVSNSPMFFGAANVSSVSGYTVNNTPTTTKPAEADGSSAEPPKKRQRRESVGISIATVDSKIDSWLDVTASTPVLSARVSSEEPQPSSLDAEDGPTPTDHVIDALPITEYKLPSGTLLHAAIETFLSTPQPAMKNSPLYTDLQSRYVFPHHPSLRLLLQPSDILHIQSLLPTLPLVSATFKSFLTAHQAYLTHNHPLHLPNYPQEIIGDNEKVKKEWLYIHASMLHFRTHFSTLQTRALSHGEGWCDVNVWAQLLDTALLLSESLSLDRKELQSCADAPAAVWVVSDANKTGLPSYDGIFRSVNGGGGGGVGTRLDLGFVEVKPARAPYPKSSRADREKVIRAMAASLHGFHKLMEASASIDAEKEKTDTSSPPSVIVIGLICNGLSMTLMRVRARDCDATNAVGGVLEGEDGVGGDTESGKGMVAGQSDGLVGDGR
ncbi:hypothetical protein TWF173_009153 [Orbilia oligospora]|nr:hypothetical protein TWF173_009153 [Orbilia oligospora]